MVLASHRGQKTYCTCFLAWKESKAVLPNILMCCGNIASIRFTPSPSSATYYAYYCIVGACFMIKGVKILIWGP